MGGGELFRNGFAANARFLRGKLRGLHGVARRGHALLGFHAAFVELA